MKKRLALVFLSLIALSGCSENEVSRSANHDEAIFESDLENAIESVDKSAPISADELRGALPDDPIESVELTVEEKRFAVMGPPVSYSPSAPPADFKFAEPVRIKADGNYVKADAPGFACPTMADIDGDGNDDLVVGQFDGGKMKVYRNLSSSSGIPVFGSPTLLTAAGEPAEVPGVW